VRKRVEAPPNWLLPALRTVSGLAVELGPARDTIAVRIGNSGATLFFNVRHIPVLSQERARELADALPAQGASSSSEVVLVATRQLADTTRTILRSAGISWIERLTGVCRLIGPGLVIDVRDRQGRAHGPGTTVRARLRDRSGWLPEYILDTGVRDRILLTDIARRAGVSTGLASRLLRRLTELKVLDTQGAGPRRTWRLADRGALLDLWANEERSKPAQSTGLYVWSRSVISLLERLPELTSAGIDWALGGTAAANLWTPTLTSYPDPAVWVPAGIPALEVAKILRGDIVEKGANLQLCQTERDIALRHAKDWTAATADSAHLPGLRLVSRPRAYIEALQGAGRSAEVAQKLRENLLKDDTTK
jgi:hypothetical protein